MKSFYAGTILERPKRTREADALKQAIAAKKKVKPNKRKPAPRRRK